MWEQLHLPLTAVACLAAAQTHLLLLTAVWGGTAGAFATLRVLLLAGTILFLAASQPLTPSRWWRAIAPGIALAALAGVPLTAGLAGQAALYQGLSLDGRLILLLVLAFLQVLLVAAGLSLVWPQAVAEVPVATRADVIQEVAILLPALGLFSPGGVAWAQISWLAWLFLLAVPLGSVVLFRFVPAFHHLVAATRRAFTFNLPLNRVTAVFTRWLQGMGGAFQETAAILEGEGSLVWLLVIILVLLVAQ
jgi:hypothetical protein